MRTCGFIKALHHVKRYNNNELALWHNTVRTRDESETAKIREAYAEIALAIDLAAVLMSDEARRCLNQYQKDSDEAKANKLPGDVYAYVDNIAGAASDCLTGLKAIAKRDLKVEDW